MAKRRLYDRKTYGLDSASVTAWRHGDPKHRIV